MKQLENTLNEYFGQKAPQLPMGLKKFIVAIIPYLNILSVIAGVMACLALIGFGGYGAGMMNGFGYPYGMMGGGSFGSMMLIIFILLAATTILQAMAIPGLFKRSMVGWRYVFYAQLVSLVSGLIGGGIIGAIIGAVIGFYFLFQVRSFYN